MTKQRVAVDRQYGVINSTLEPKGPSSSGITFRGVCSAVGWVALMIPMCVVALFDRHTEAVK